MEISRKDLILSVLSFLQEEINSDDFKQEEKESLEVAMQCLQSTYGLEMDSQSAPENVINLRELFLSRCEADTKETEAEKYKEMGNEAMRRCDYEAALKYYTEAINLSPKNSKYYCNRAAAHVMQKMYQEAIADAKEAIRLNPTYSKAYYRLGNALMGLERYTEAREEYCKAVNYEKHNQHYQAAVRYCDQQIDSQNKATSGQNRNTPTSSCFTNLMSSPEILNLTTQILNSPNCVRNLMTNMMSPETRDTAEANLEELAAILSNGVHVNANSINPETVEDFISKLNKTRDNDPNTPP